MVAVKVHVPLMVLSKKAKPNIEIQILAVVAVVERYYCYIGGVLQYLRLLRVRQH